MIVTLIIANKDEADLPSGHKRKKAGDIIAVCPEDHYGGVVTRKTHLLVRVNLGNTIKTIQDAKKLMVPEFETGEYWYPEETPNIIGKRRHRIPFAELVAKAQAVGVNIDMDQLLNPDIDYQPLENKTFAVSQFIWDKVNGRKLTNADLVAIKNFGK